MPTQKPSNILAEEIVLMEDDISTQRSIKKWLMAIGFKVTTIRGTREAVRLAKECNSLRRLFFILDINMGPDRQQEGLDVLERIKNVDRGIFVAILTGYPRRYAEMARRLGANAVEEKTASMNDDLLAILEAILDYKRAGSSAGSDDGHKRIGGATDLLGHRAELRRSMSRWLDTNELQNLCFDMGVDFEDLPMGDKDTKIRGFLLYCQRHARLKELMTLLRELRPAVVW